jgi:hypothetical protein
MRGGVVAPLFAFAVTLDAGCGGGKGNTPPMTWQDDGVMVSALSAKATLRSSGGSDSYEIIGLDANGPSVTVFVTAPSPIAPQTFPCGQSVGVIYVDADRRPRPRRPELLRRLHEDRRRRRAHRGDVRGRHRSEGREPEDDLERHLQPRRQQHVIGRAPEACRPAAGIGSAATTWIEFPKIVREFARRAGLDPRLKRRVGMAIWVA